MISGHICVQVLPGAFDLVVVGAVGRKKVQYDSPTFRRLQTLLHLFGVVDGVVVENDVYLLRVGVVEVQFP